MDSIRNKILITDDSEMNRMILCDMLENEFSLLEAEGGKQAIDILEQHADEIALVLLDVVMPEMDGFAVLEEMNARHWIDDIQVVMISAEAAPLFMHRAYDLGAVDFISRPFDQTIVYRRIMNTIMLFAKQKQLTDMVNEQIAERQKNTNMMISILSHIVEFRNGESGQHVQHINTLTRIILEQLLEKTDRYDEIREDLNIICLASSLHDVGKIGLPEAILNKPGRLTDEEYDIIKTHPEIGADIMRRLPQFQSEPLMRYSYQICRWHHERWDGSGYPDGLAGDEIPIAAQIVALADVYDALTSVRCYKDAYSHRSAMQMILDGQCGSFNPLLIQCLQDADAFLQNGLE